MPTYDYACEACGHEFELFQSMTAAVKRKCPECGKPKLKRLIGTGAGVIFKGGGFYETDYRSDSYRKAAEKDRKAAEGTKGDGDGAKKKKAGADGGGTRKKTSGDGGTSKATATAGAASG